MKPITDRSFYFVIAFFVANYFFLTPLVEYKVISILANALATMIIYYCTHLLRSRRRKYLILSGAVVIVALLELPLVIYLKPQSTRPTPRSTQINGSWKTNDSNGTHLSLKFWPDSVAITQFPDSVTSVFGYEIWGKDFYLIDLKDSSEIPWQIEFLEPKIFKLHKKNDTLLFHKVE